MKKKWSVQDILNLDRCPECTEDRIAELFKSVGCRKYITIDKMFEINIPYEDFFWLILRPEFIPEKQLYQIAIWCFEKIAQPIWEKYYSEDNRPQEAVRIKKLWLKGKATDEELAAAADAVWIAKNDTAEDAAESSAKTAEVIVLWDTMWIDSGVAAWVAARSAARAAACDVAGHVTWAAEWIAARDATNQKIKQKIKKIIGELK